MMVAVVVAELDPFVTSALRDAETTAWALDVATGALRRRGADGADDTTLAAATARIHPDDRAAVAAALAAVIDGAASAEERAYRRADGAGGWRWVESSYRATARDAAGRAVTVVGVSRDVTRRWTAEREVQVVAERLRSYMTTGRTPIWCFEPAAPIALDLPPDQQLEQLMAARVVDCNDAFAIVRGQTRAEVMGRPVPEVAFVGVEAVRAMCVRLVAHGYRLTDYPLTGPDRTGRVRHLLGAITGVIVDGRVVRVWGSFEDRTEEVLATAIRAELETHLHQVRRLDSLGALAGGIAHDFNNLLAVVLTGVDLAADATAAGRDVGAELAAIRDAAQRAGGHVERPGLDGSLGGRLDERSTAGLTSYGAIGLWASVGADWMGVDYPHVELQVRRHTSGAAVDGTDFLLTIGMTRRNPQRAR